MSDHKPGYIERMQIEEERAAKREDRSALRSIVITLILIVLMGWGFMVIWVLVRRNFGRWGRERARQERRNGSD
jgi:hypothetical protein